MKQTRLVLALIVTSLAATPAFAASVTMLQFGSFETRAEAEKRLGEISSKYKDTLGTLPTTIREVKLPPDNLTVYRTQAGPVADRSSAQSICSKLASTGDECYIVQTAMVGGTPAAAVASVAPELTAAKNTELAAATNGSPDLTSKLSTLQESRDPLNRAALNSVSTTQLATDEQASSTASPAMNAALDKAVGEQNAVANDVNTSTAAAQPQSSGGFWSRLNPFTPSTPKPVVVAKTPDTAAPIETVAVEALPAPTSAPMPELAPTPTPPPVAVAAAPIVVTPIVPAVKTVSTSAPAAGFDNSPVVNQAPVMQLPPPPAPLKAQDRTNLASGKAPLAAPEPVAVPISTIPATTGTVQVEEARRVPVTSTTTMPAQQGASAIPVATPFTQAPVSLQPSSTEGIKTIWAQIGPFASNDDALAFWGNYRQNHPDFPVVRVRVTSSYQQLVRGMNNYALRVGPMAQKAFVSNLCASVNAPAPQGQPQPPQMKCGMVSDLGISTPLQPNGGMLPTSRYGARH